MPDLLITGGLVVDPATRLEARRDVLLRGRTIAGIIKPGTHRADRAKRLDASGCWVVPGLIDMHVHLRDLGQKTDETIATGTLAAARGGVTTVLAMANTRPSLDSAAIIRKVRSRAKKEGLVNVLFAGAVTRGLKGRALTEFKSLAAAGAAAFSDDGRPVMNAELMRRALVHAKKLGRPVLDHAEDDHLTGKGVVHKGVYSAAAGIPGIPNASESAMSARDIALAEATGAHLHICHVSCAETVALVRDAKRRGARITAEAAPHHFTLADSDIARKNASDFKMKPPLRSIKDRNAVRAGLADGTLDAIATDHAPHAPAKKAKGILTAPFGIIGLETLIPLSLALLGSKGLSRLQLVDRLSTGPARILGLKNKGILKRFADADVTIIDPSASWTVTQRSASKSRNTPFIGRRMRGRARATIVSGKIVYHADQAR